MPARTRLAALLSLSALALVGCGDSTAEDPTPTSGSAREQQQEPSADPTSAAPSEPADTKAAAVYFVGDTPQGPRLYREFHQVDAADPAAGALAVLASGDATDPDYRSLFPAGEFEGVEVGTDAITVSVPESWTEPADGMTDEQARLAAQQLVYTVQGAAQSRLPVHVEHAGAPVDLFGLGGELGNEPEIDVRALVNVTSPEEGATVTGTFTASGVSSSFEATTPWQIRKGGPDGEVVAEGHATADGWMDKLYPWQTDVDVSDLPAGQYTFVALTDDPSDGEGAGPMLDTKSITIQ